LGAPPVRRKGDENATAVNGENVVALEAYDLTHQPANGMSSQVCAIGTSECNDAAGRIPGAPSSLSIHNQYPGHLPPFCFDIGHARQVDSTMTKAYFILKTFGSRLRQAHVTEVSTRSKHDPLSLASILAFREVAARDLETSAGRVPLILVGMKRNRRAPLCLGLAGLFLLAHTPQLWAQTAEPPRQPVATPASEGVAVQRLSHLRHGVNLSGWFAQVADGKGYTKEHFLAHTTAQDIALIHAMGFDHVRLSINPQPMFREGEADAIPKDYLDYLDEAVQDILANDLAVILDMQPESDFKRRLASDDFVEQFANFWRAFAKHYGALDPNRVFFEILNEPELQDRYRWAGIQAKLAAAIREGAPRHTIIASGARWSGDDELLFLEPLRDANAIYNFHFYEPHIFTHQGANWAVPFWHFEHGLVYPSTPESAEKVAAEVPEAANRLYVIRYGFERWSSNRIEAEIRQVAEWGQRYAVPVLCDEFGVYRRYSDTTSRLTWLADVRTALERHGMGWTLWDYSGSFGVVDKTDGKAVPDKATLQALGLKAP
jgi:aryl-phospho-beta-D-glucosidase BglC (GH1 family)